MAPLLLSEDVRNLIALRDQMLELKLSTVEVQEKINTEFAVLLDDVESQIMNLQKQKKEILSYIVEIDDVKVQEVFDEMCSPTTTVSDTEKKKEAKEVPKVEVKIKNVKIKLTKEKAHKVDILDINSGKVTNAGETIALSFKGKQKVGQDAYVFDWYGTTQKGWISNHVLYTGTTYLDRKYGKLYIVTKDGITSAKMSVLEQYIVDYGKEVLIGDGMSIINPNYIKIKSGFDIDFV